MVARVHDAEAGELEEIVEHTPHASHVSKHHANELLTSCEIQIGQLAQQPGGSHSRANAVLELVRECAIEAAQAILSLVNAGLHSHCVLGCRRLLHHGNRTEEPVRTREELALRARRFDLVGRAR
jgi:hypothetical protein